VNLAVVGVDQSNQLFVLLHVISERREATLNNKLASLAVSFLDHNLFRPQHKVVEALTVTVERRIVLSRHHYIS